MADPNHADYLAAMADALAEGDVERAEALRHLAEDSAAVGADGLGEAPAEVRARARAARDAFVSQRLAREKKTGKPMPD